MHNNRPGRGRRGGRGIRLAESLPAGQVNFMWPGSMRKTKRGEMVCYRYVGQFQKSKGPAYYRERALQTAIAEQDKSGLLRKFLGVMPVVKDLLP